MRRIYYLLFIIYYFLFASSGVITAAEETAATESPVLKAAETIQLAQLTHRQRMLYSARRTLRAALSSSWN